MAPKIFLTGVTGYIAGDALYALNQKHPDYEYSALVRTQEKADIVKKAFPNIRIVLGGNDDSDLLKEEATKADIVLHAADASDHEGAAKAIAEGIRSGHSKENPGYWLHTGGTGILTYTDSEANRLGEWSEKEYNDWTGVEELTTLPDSAFHRNVDKVVLEAGTKYADVVKTNIVCPPTIYGNGRGPLNTRGRQVYELAKLILTGKYIPIIGPGKARWNHIHVADLSDAYVLLVEAAVSGTRASDAELWGAKGYTFTERGEHVWGELSRLVGKKAVELGYVGELEEQALEKEKALEQAGFEAISWGLNSRGYEGGIEDEVEEILKAEHARLQK
ncbi:hypothetical protein Q7P35_005029 [Cladosporium inversicolor]